MKQSFRTRRIHFFLFFSVIVIALAVVKCVNPAVTLSQMFTFQEQPVKAVSQPLDSVAQHAVLVDSLLLRPRQPLLLTKSDGTPVRNKVISVPRFDDAFPDLNDVQLVTAQRLGISQIENRDDARHHMRELVFIGDNPYYTVQDLHQSIPYLVPRAATLLNEIARSFMDSLLTKGYEPHKLLVTSVLRTNEDINRLRRINRNASENSCHRFGTTFDISYNRFVKVNDNCEEEIKWVTIFKSILAEVLNDQRQAGTCYVKYEVHQSCFHITAR